MTVDQVAEYLSIKVSSIYSKIAQIPHYRVGRLLRFRQKDIDGWMEGHRQDSQTSATVVRKGRKVMKRAGSAGRSDVDNIVRKAIDQAHGNGYNSLGKSDSSTKGLRKEG